MRFLQLVTSALALAGLAVAKPSPTTKRDVKFVSTADGAFTVDGSPFAFVGTNAYWLSSLNTKQDIKNTLQNIADHGIKVVRVWGFNDVDTIPVNGTWFQLIQGDTVTINQGANGLPKLDMVIKAAEKIGLRVQLVLTNNWNPLPELDDAKKIKSRDVTAGTGNNLPRNFLSNDFGGMDLYVRQLGVSRTHDEFYTNRTIINTFKNYISQVVTRYVNSPAIFSWEIANDPRCNSSIPAQPTCNTQTITRFLDEIGAFIHSIDPNHLVTSGAHGFICTDCPKLFPPQPVVPPPQVSPAPGSRRRRAVPVTEQSIKRQFTDMRKREFATLKREASGPKIRGRWVATHAARNQDPTTGIAFDGSTGVDSGDIINSPNIDYASFQTFPDQNEYFPPNANLPDFNNSLNAGLQWIQLQAQLAALANKPVVLTGFGLVTQDNAKFFIPFNTTTSPVNNVTGILEPGGSFTKRQSQAAFGISNVQQDSAYSQWLSAAASFGVSGASQYQWGQTGLTTSPGSAISPNVDSSGTSGNTDTSGISPNDGYSFAGTGTNQVASVLQSATSLFG